MIFSHLKLLRWVFLLYLFADRIIRLASEYGRVSFGFLFGTPKIIQGKQSKRILKVKRYADNSEVMGCPFLFFQYVKFRKRTFWRRKIMKEKNQIYKCPVCGYLLSEISSEIPDHCPGCLSGIHETDAEGEVLLIS